MSAAWPELAAFERELYACSNCGYCVDGAWPARGLDGPCAAWNQHARAESVTGRGFLALGRALHEDAALADASVAERAFACTQCGACASACPVGLHPHAIARAVRAGLVARGALPDAALDLRQALLTCGNPWGDDPATRDDWSAGLVPPGAPDLLLWPGCAAAHRAPAEARAAWLLLARAGHAPAFAQGEPCCGAPLRALGMDTDAAVLGAGVAGPLAQAGVPVVTPSGACAGALRAAGLEVHSVIEVLAADLAAGRLRLHPHPGAPQRVGVVDACTHARPTGPGPDLPALTAQVLAAMQCQVVQTHAPAFAPCCGAGGGMAQLHPQSAARMARARAEALAAAGAQALIAGAPECAVHLADHAGDALPVYGLAEFIAAHCELSA